MKTCLIVLMLTIHLGCFAQQDPLYAQYLLNPLAINPAYAGFNDNFNAMAGYRLQWTGFEGQPNTIYASAHSSVLNRKGGVGLVIVNDRIGNVTNNEVNLSFAYKLRFEDRTLSFGMQAGFQSYASKIDDLNIYNAGDMAFSGDDRATRLNIGTGVMYKTDQLSLGISVPRLLPTTFENAGGEFELYNQHYYFLASYLHYLNERVWIKPSAMVRAIQSAPASIDVAVNFIFNGKHSAGLFTRNLKTNGLLLQTVLNERFFLGYVFEVPTNRSVGTNFTTHEVNLGMRLSLLPYHDRLISNY